MAKNEPESMKFKLLAQHLDERSLVWRLLDEFGYSMQSNQKKREGMDHPDRNAQFEFIMEMPLSC